MKATILKLWNSPTFTTWGNQLTQSFRLLLVTPLILSHFNQTEIAAWYLFATLNFFGLIVGQRLGVSFSRMISFAMGGATDLSPIADSKKVRDVGTVSWKSIARTLGTLGLIQSGIAWLNMAIATGMGYLALSSLLENYNEKEKIWIAFVIMQVSSLISFIYNRYGIVLQGMNHVAVVNRWNIIFNFASIVTGVFALKLGVGLWELALVMQSVYLGSILRNRFLLRYYTRGKISNIDRISWDADIARWAWGPTWRGFIGQFTNVGLAQLSGVIFAIYAAPGAVATYLFTLRMIDTISNFSHATVTSKIPVCSKLLVRGDIEGVAKIFYKRVSLAGWLAFSAFVVIGVSGGWLLKLVDANISFISPQLWFVFALLASMKGYLNLAAMPCGFGNRVIFHWRYLVAALVALSILPFMLPRYGIIGIIVSLWAPIIVVLNFAPFIEAAKVLHVQPMTVVRRTVLPFALFACFVVVYLLLMPSVTAMQGTKL